ncbi:MAG: transposase, partial [Tannerella sp.]|nr:transposase [Tannerella sp.]
MFSLSESNRYAVCVIGVGLRKGLDGLYGLIHCLSLSSGNGDVYVFFNRSRTTMKLVH